MAGLHKADGTVLYRPSRGLQSVLGVTFLVLMLFMVNALAGAIWLATHNLPTDSVIFAVMFATSAALLVYAGLFLFAASHSEVRLGPDRAMLVLPNWRGPTPLFPYTETEVRYADLEGVETRGEIYRYLILPVSVQSACLVRKDGRRLTLGYIRAMSQDHAMPFHDIAAEIAQRAGVPLTDRGVVDAGRGVHALVQDEPEWDEPQLAPERVAALHRQESLRLKILMGLGLAAAIAAIGFQLTRMVGA
jgi:hypothetical protein